MTRIGAFNENLSLDDFDKDIWETVCYTFRIGVRDGQNPKAKIPIKGICPESSPYPYEASTRKKGQRD